MADLVPASAHIHTKSLPNVDTDRLHRRLGHLGAQFKDDPANNFDGKAEFGDRVRETINVERELARRGESFTPVTNGKHLEAVPVSEVPYMGPRPGKKERKAQLEARNGA